MSEERFKVRVDVSEVDTELKRLQVNSTQTARNVNTQLRRSYDTLVLFTSLVGETLDLSYQLMAQGLFTAAGTIISISAATPLTVFGVFRAGLGFIAAASLFAKGIQVQLKGPMGGAELNAIIMAGNTWRLHS